MNTFLAAIVLWTSAAFAAGNVAVDGERLESQSAGVRETFVGAFGDDAGDRWASEHDAELRRDYPGRASDGQSLWSQPEDVQAMFIGTFGSPDAAVRAWVEQHESALSVQLVGDPHGYAALLFNRPEGTPWQTGNTCAIVSQQEVLLGLGIRAREDELYRSALDRGFFTQSVKGPCIFIEKKECTIKYDRYAHTYEVFGPEGSPVDNGYYDIAATFRSYGGTWPDTIGAFMEDQGFRVERSGGALRPVSMEAQRQVLIAQLMQGRLPIVTGDPSILWRAPGARVSRPGDFVDASHAVVVTGVRLERGRPAAYYVNDSGVGAAYEVEASLFEDFWQRSQAYLVYAMRS